MSTVAFSEVERDFLRANGQRIQFEKLAEAARIAYVGAEVNTALKNFTKSLRALCGPNTSWWPMVIYGLSGGAPPVDA